MASKTAIFLTVTKEQLKLFIFLKVIGPFFEARKRHERNFSIPMSMNEHFFRSIVEDSLCFDVILQASFSTSKNKAYL